MRACPSIPIGDDATLAGTLQSLDCQVNGAVAGGYEHIFGSGGALGLALSIGLTLYLVIFALGLLAGHTRLSLSTVSGKVLALGFVLTFAAGWPAYQTVVLGLLTGGPDQLAAAMMGAKSGATQAFAARVDVLFDAVIDVGRQVASLPKSPNLQTAVSLIWASASLLLISTLGLLVIARIVLAVLLALGPVFIVFGLFAGTRGLFEGWLRTAVAFALAPMLIVLGGSGLLAALGPAIDAVADDPARAALELRPVVTLFAGALIYAGLVLTLMGVGFSLTRGWRLPRPKESTPTAAGSSAEAHAWAASHAQATPIPAAEARAGEVAAAILRRSEPVERGRSLTLVESLPAAGAPAASPRADGLGRSFRPAPDRRVLSGPLGS